MVEITSGWSGRSLGHLSVFSPEVRLTDIVVIWNRDGGTIFHDVTKAQSELNPAGGVLGVMIGLISGEEEKVRVLLNQVRKNGGARSLGPAGVAGEIADDDDILVDRILANEPFKHRVLSMTNSIGNVFGVVPAFDAEVGTPSGIENFLSRRFFPGVAIFELKSDFAIFIIEERKKLGREFEDASVMGVERKGDDLVPGHVQIDEPLRSLLLCLSRWAQRAGRPGWSLLSTTRRRRLFQAWGNPHQKEGQELL